MCWCQAAEICNVQDKRHNMRAGPTDHRLRSKRLSFLLLLYNGQRGVWTSILATSFESRCRYSEELGWNRLEHTMPNRMEPSSVRRACPATTISSQSPRYSQKNGFTMGGKFINQSHLVLYTARTEIRAAQLAALQLSIGRNHTRLPLGGNHLPQSLRGCFDAISRFLASTQPTAVVASEP